MLVPLYVKGGRACALSLFLCVLNRFRYKTRMTDFSGSGKISI